MSSAMRRIPDNAILTSVVGPTESATAGYGAVFITSDLLCDDAGLNTGLCVGVFMDTAAADAKARIQIDHVAAVDLSGVATRGTLAQVTATGFENIPAANTAGASTTYCYGRFMQSGVSGDQVGLNLACAGGTVVTA